MALNNPNPFDEILISGDRDAGVPFETLPKGISPETPEDINPFDAIGYEAPPEPSYQKVGDYRGAEILQDEGGKWYSKSEQGLVELPEEVKGQVQAELGGLEEPWIDPLTVAGGAAGVSGRLAYRAGARGLELLGRTALSAGIAGGAEYPLGVITEAVGKEHPELAPYVNIGLGILSGVTIENFVEKAIIGKGLTPTARAVNKYITELKAGIISDDVATKAASDITEEVKVKQPDIVDRIHGERADEIYRMQEANKEALREGFKEPKPLTAEDPTFKNYGEEIKDRFPDADADDIAFVSREVAQDFRDIKDPRTEGNAQAWERFAETGAEAGPRGGKESFEFGKENFETKMREHLEFKASVDEGAARAGKEIPEEVNAFDAITKELPSEAVQAKAATKEAITRPIDEAGEGIPRYEQIPGDVQAGSLAFGQALPKQAASVNLERVGADYSTKKMILDVSDQYKGQIDEARRGKITHETTRELAEDLGMTEKQLLRRRKGRAGVS